MVSYTFIIVILVRIAIIHVSWFVIPYIYHKLP